MGLTLDESSDDDNVFEINGIKFLITKNLDTRIGDIDIDYKTGWNKGFTVRPRLGGGC